MSNLRHRLEQLAERGSARGADAVLDAAVWNVATGRAPTRRSMPVARRKRGSRTRPPKPGSGAE